MIQLDDKALKELMVAAVLQTIDGAKRDAIIKTAIETLMTPVRNSYTSVTESPLQAAFNIALVQVAQKIAREELQSNDAVRAAVREKIVAGYEKAVKDEDYKLVDNIAAAVAKAFRGDDYR